jgi:hypothetical protein
LKTYEDYKKEAERRAAQEAEEAKEAEEIPEAEPVSDTPKDNEKEDEELVPIWSKPKKAPESKEEDDEK